MRGKKCLEKVNMEKVKNLWIFLAFFFTLITFFQGFGGVNELCAQEEHSRVCLGQLVTHPALDAMVEGIQEILKDYPSITLEIGNAQGNMAVAKQLAHKFLSQNPDGIISLTTPLTQTMVATFKGTVPIFYGAVTDPEQAHIAKPSGAGNVWGVVDQPPLREQASLIKKILPSLKVLGLPYNSGEANSVIFVERMAKELAPAGIKPVFIAVTQSREVVSAVKAILHKVDGFYLPQDNTVIAATDAILSLLKKEKKPVFTSVTEIVHKGAVTAVGYGFHAMGRDIGNMVVQKIMHHKSPPKGIQTPSETQLFINKTEAQALNIVIPEDLLKSATKVF